MRYSDKKSHSTGIDKRILAILLVVLIVVAILIAVPTVKSLNKRDEHRQVEASLYGYRTSGNIILQDSNGQLWEIDYNDAVKSDSVILLDVTGYQINRVFIEVPNPTETVNQG